MNISHISLQREQFESVFTASILSIVKINGHIDINAIYDYNDAGSRRMLTTSDSLGVVVAFALVTVLEDDGLHSFNNVSSLVDYINNTMTQCYNSDSLKTILIASNLSCIANLTSIEPNGEMIVTVLAIAVSTVSTTHSKRSHSVYAATASCIVLFLAYVYYRRLMKKKVKPTKLKPSEIVDTDTKKLPEDSPQAKNIKVKGKYILSRLNKKIKGNLKYTYDPTTELETSPVIQVREKRQSPLKVITDSDNHYKKRVSHTILPSLGRLPFGATSPIGSIKREESVLSSISPFSSFTSNSGASPARINSLKKFLSNSTFSYNNEPLNDLDDMENNNFIAFYTALNMNNLSKMSSPKSPKECVIEFDQFSQTASNSEDNDDLSTHSSN